MVSIDLADTLTFGPGTGISVVDDVRGHLGVGGCRPGPRTSWRGRSPLVGRSASVRIVKRIPAGAGLGGGSADAAAVLRWAGDTDLAVAVRLGADVPFCVRGGRARVTGVGEKVEPLPFEDRRFVAVAVSVVRRHRSGLRAMGRPTCPAQCRRARRRAGGKRPRSRRPRGDAPIGALASGVGGRDRPDAAAGGKRFDVVRRGGRRGPGHRRTRLPRHGGPERCLGGGSDRAGHRGSLRGTDTAPHAPFPLMGAGVGLRTTCRRPAAASGWP